MRIGTNVHIRHVVIGRLLQLATGKRAGGVTMEQQRQHHAQVIRLGTPPLMDRHQRTHIQLLDNVDHEPSQMVLRQIILNTVREQIAGVAIHGNEFNGISVSSWSWHLVRPFYTICRAKSDRLLGGIRGAAQLLKKELAFPEQIEYTDIIIAETDRLRSLVDRMLGPSQSTKLEPVNIHQILERVIRLLFTKENAQIAIRRDFDQLIQAVVNMIKNAIEAVSSIDQPVIRIATRVEHNFTIEGHMHAMIAHVVIEDNGIGITDEIQERIFYPLVSKQGRRSRFGLSHYSINNRRTSRSSRL